MASVRPALPMKIEVQFERRDDGGLRAYAEGVPGFVLSNRDPDAVFSDVPTVLAEILSGMFGARVAVMPLIDVASALSESAVPAHMCQREYVGTPIPA